ncbi:hypothetical protein KUF71_019253 [Frankliniella fusca]|uniref:Uncharacterized protein n=1 Tax=Frankliniella fusca TaxID=407009 RepID=A0AAE1GTL0_9NEOP|nr:hypothetical protein KUF71_019253 [Frankliniella fusca]
MSTRKGESTRKRPQKYQNTRAFKNDLHDKTVQTKALNNLQISNVCKRCKSILDWRIKYKKFKPLKAPATCTKCSQKCVKHAYHMMCKPCADKFEVCPKCGKKEELVEPQPTPEELLKLDQEMQAMLKSLPERKRRTFLRFVEKGKKKERKKNKDNNDGGNTQTSDSKDVPVEDEDEDNDAKKGTQDLMAFLQRLKLSCKDGSDDFDDFDDFGSSDSDNFGSDEDEDGDEDEDEK